MKHDDTTWYIFRHALATRSMSGYGDKILTAQILNEAIPPIESMARYLSKIPESTNVSSTLLRCVQTTEIITRITGKKFLTDSRLNEYFQESFAEFNERVNSWIKDMRGRKTTAVLICTHGAVVAGIKHLLIDGDFSEAQLLDYPNCGELLVIKNDFRIINFNVS